MKNRMGIGLILSLVVILFLAWVAYRYQNEARQQAHGASTAQAEAQFQQSESKTARATAVAEKGIRQTAQAEAKRTQATATTAFKGQATTQAKTETQLQAADKLRARAEALWLAESAETAWDETSLGLIQSTLLAVESMKRTPTFEGDMKLHQGLGLLPRSIMEFPQANYVEAATFSPDGRWLAVGGWDNAVTVWEVATQKEIARMPHTDTVFSVAFSPNGRFLVTQSGQKTVQLWNPATGRQVAQMIHSDRVQAIALSPDGRWLATVSDDKLAQIWEVATGQKVAQMPHPVQIYDIAFSSDGGWLATASWDNQAYLWDVKTGKELATFKHNSPVYNVAFAPSSLDNKVGHWLVTASEEGMAKVWLVGADDVGKIITQTEIAQLDHEAEVQNVTFSPFQPRGADRALFATVSGQAVHLWSMAYIPRESVTEIAEQFSVGKIAHITQNSPVYALAFSPNRYWVATGNADNTARIWDFTPSPYNGFNISEFARIPHTRPVSWVSFSSDSGWLGTASAATVQVRQTDPVIGLNRVHLNHEEVVIDMVFSPDSQRITTFDVEGHKRIWDVATGQEVDSLETGQVSYVGTVSADGRYWARATSDISVRAIDEERDVTHIHISGDNLAVMAFSPDNQWLATGGSSGVSALWHVATGKQITPINISDSVFDLAFSPDGKILAVSRGVNYMPDSSGQVTILGLNHDVISDSVTFQEITTLNYDRPAQDMAFSPNGRWLAIANENGTIQILEASTGEEANRLILEASTGEKINRLRLYRPAKTLDFSQDGHWLMVKSRETLTNTLRIWRFTETDTENPPILDEVSRMVDLSTIGNFVLSPNNEWLAFTDENNTVRLWRWQSADLLAEACARLPRNLTRQEWKAFIGGYQPYQATCTNLPTPALPPTATPSPMPTPTSSPTPSPTPMPPPKTVISPDNAKQLRWFVPPVKDGDVTDLVWHPQGEWLAVAGSEDVTLHSMLNAGVVHSIDGAVSRLAVSPDGSVLATTDGKAVRLWQLPDRKLLKILPVPADEMAFSPDGTMLAVAHGRDVQLWRLAGYQWVRTFEGTSGSKKTVGTIAFSPDGTILAAGTEKGTVHLWQVSNGDLIRTLEATAYDVAFSPDGAKLAVATGKQVKIWQRSDGTLLTTISGENAPAHHVAFSPDGRLLASDGPGDYHTVNLWRAIDGKRLHTLEGHAKTVNSLAFSPDGLSLATTAEKSEVRLWNVSEGSLTETWHPTENYGGDFTAITFSPDGNLLASGAEDGLIRLYHWPEGRLFETLTEHQGAVMDVAFSPDGQRLASASWDDHSILVWRVNDWSLQQTLTGHSNGVRSIAFSPDGTLLASGSEDKTARLWQVTDGTVVRVFHQHEHGVYDVNFFSDGQTLATMSGPIQLWRVADGKLIQTLEESDIGGSPTFSPDGTILAMSDDAVVELWDITTNTLLRKLYGNTSKIDSIAFSPDGQIIAAAEEGSGTVLWQVADGAYLTTVSSAPHSKLLFSADGTVLVSRSSYGYFEPFVIVPSPKAQPTPSPAAVPLGGGGGHIAMLGAAASGCITPSCSGLDIRIIKVNGEPHSTKDFYLNVYWARDFQWSPDGQHLAVIKNDAYHSDGAIYIATRGNSRLRKLIDGRYEKIIWSPDGSQVAYCCRLNYDIPSSIFISKINGANQRQLVTDVYASDLAWSPSGDRIAYSASKEDEKRDIYTIDVEGHHLQQLTTHEAEDTAPVWSPDGKHIAFVSSRDGNEEIYTMDTSGGNLRNLSRNAASDTFPTWSHDGRHLLFVSNRDGNEEIYIVQADGQNPRNLTQHQADDTGPDWSPDGTQIAFVSNRDNNPEIYLMDIDGGNQRRLTHSDFYEREPLWQP